jgi:hypothetical protein
VDVDLQAAVAVLQILAVAFGLRVAGELVASEVGIVRGEAVVAGEGMGEVLWVGLEGVIVDLGISAHHESAEIVEGDAFLLGEIVHRSGECLSLLHLLIPEELVEIPHGEKLLHVKLEGFELSKG